MKHSLKSKSKRRWLWRGPLRIDSALEPPHPTNPPLPTSPRELIAIPEASGSKSGIGGAAQTTHCARR
jgi:hypothetical protein